MAWSEALTNLTTVGLFWDGLGITVLGLPAVYRSSQGFMKESAGRYGYNLDYVRAKVADQLDLALGSIMLGVGFLLQLLGSIEVISTPLWVGAVLCGAPMPLLFAYFVGAKKRLQEAWVLKARKRRWDDLPEDKRDNENNPYEA